MITHSEEPYWSERHGRRGRPSLTDEQLRRLFVSTIEELENRQLLQEHFGYRCVDSDFVPGKFGNAIDERLILRIGHEDVWPVTIDKVHSWDNDKLFDIIYFLHDVVSVGDEQTGHFHS